MMKKAVIAIGILAAVAGMAALPAPRPTGPTIAIDSTTEMYYAAINDTVVVEGMPPATRLYVYTKQDMLYRVCSISWQLAYINEGNMNVLRTGQVQMNGTYYDAYVADDRKIVHLFNYAANQIGVTIQ